MGSEPTPGVERGGRLDYLSRRFLAKSFDSAVFVYSAVLIASVVFPTEFSTRGIVPLFGSAVWALGVFVVADSLCAVILGATPGEFLFGIRVLSADGAKPSWSQRQDRTTDALAEGTLGLPRLAALFWRGKPAPYDRDFQVRLLPMSPARGLIAGLGLAMAMLFFVASTVTLGRVDERGQPGATLSRIVASLGFPQRGTWTNPVTGIRIPLPDDWQVISTLQRPFLGEFEVEFGCGPAAASCYAKLAMGPYYPPEGETFLTVDALENWFVGGLGDDLGEKGIATVAEPSGGARFQGVYTADLDRSSWGPTVAGTAFLWFTPGQSWLMSVTRPLDDERLADEARELALRIISTTPR